MSLLELRSVAKRYGRGAQERIVLSDVSLEMEPGELVAVWGMRRSGRSTLLRVAAGIEPPDAGTVCFEGRAISSSAELLGSGIGYCRRTFRASEGDVVLDHLVMGQIARGVPAVSAEARARTALERTGAASCATFKPSALDGAELVRVAIARALTLAPRLLVVDEPTIGVDLLQRDDILRLLQSLTKEGVGVLMSTGETSGLSGARALTLSDGRLRGGTTRELAAIVPLRRPA
jgi:putative ABC transport system ATP-binding protein